MCTFRCIFPFTLLPLYFSTHYDPYVLCCFVLCSLCNKYTFAAAHHLFLFAYGYAAIPSTFSHDWSNASSASTPTSSLSQSSSLFCSYHGLPQFHSTRTGDLRRSTSAHLVDFEGPQQPTRIDQHDDSNDGASISFAPVQQKLVFAQITDVRAERAWRTRAGEASCSAVLDRAA